MNILVDASDKTSTQVMDRKTRLRYPSNPLFEKMETLSPSHWKTMRRQANSERVPSNITASAANLGLGRLPYGLSIHPETFLSRSEELIQATRKEIETEAETSFSSCSLRSSTVNDSTDAASSDNPTALGILAIRDIAVGQPFLIDTIVLVWETRD